MAYVVSQRTHEIGVRIALCAAAPEVFGLDRSHGLRLTAVGMLFGAAGSFLVSRWLKSLLFGVPSGGLTTLALTAVLLMAVAALACLVPARRAMRVEPIAALRAE